MEDLVQTFKVLGVDVTEKVKFTDEMSAIFGYVRVNYGNLMYSRGEVHGGVREYRFGLKTENEDIASDISIWRHDKKANSDILDISDEFKAHEEEIKDAIKKEIKRKRLKLLMGEYDVN